MRMKPVFLLLILLFPSIVFCQTGQKQFTAVRISEPPHIDGKLDDACWIALPAITDFTQFVPTFKVPPTQKTSVKIAYDDNAIYIGAMMYDNAPDSILHQLGNRDDELNTDLFAIAFDTWNLQTDAYVFMVSASGVQSDSRYIDDTYNAVWQSAARINDSGWIAEIKIPYSAIRFPNKEEHTWGMQINRTIRRHRETDHWSLIDKGVDNELVFWGKLTGINKIKAPLRLSFSPYLSLYGDHYPYNIEGKSNLSGSYSGGMDLKWGINDSYTLDMTLLPDFSQVQSDDQVKNISAFETEYDENRSFFNEGIDLFAKGGLFYSRRIGRQPGGYYSVADSLVPGEYIDKNPGQAKLLNATKVSGRGKNGTAIGFFNAITDNMYARVKDSSGNSRKVLTEPLTNYNILVFDQILKNNSNVYVINTDVIRTKGFDDANVTAAGFTLNDKKNTWQFSGSGALSQKFHRTDSAADGTFENTLGYTYKLGFAKVSGKFQFSIARNEKNSTYDINDFGILFSNNEAINTGWISYNIYEPFGIVREMNNSLTINYIDNNQTHDPINFEFELQNYETFTNYLSFWDGIGLMPIHAFDFYEPRVQGRYFMQEPYYYIYAGISSDYRKVFALDAQFTWISTIDDPSRRIEASLTPLVRATDKFNINYTISYNQGWNDKGFADIDTGSSVIFGRRDLMEIENSLNARYIFKNDLSLSLRARHYWAMGEYKNFYTLSEDGWLESNSAYDGVKDYDFNYNSFNIDLIFSWQFAPGSTLSIAWKNAILADENVVIHNYWDNITHTFKSDQLNSLSIKVLYYLDSQYFRKKHKNKVS
jgi:hypothetical protein